jgi:hypothetical protein
MSVVDQVRKIVTSGVLDGAEDQALKLQIVVLSAIQERLEALEQKVDALSAIVERQMSPPETVGKVTDVTG